jgi:hypothetical protein
MLDDAITSNRGDISSEKITCIEKSANNSSNILDVEDPKTGLIETDLVNYQIPKL